MIAPDLSLDKTIENCKSSECAIYQQQIICHVENNEVPSL